MKSIRSFALALAATLSFTTNAHEGHGHEHPLSPGHFLANPEHALPLTLIIALVVALSVRSYFIARRDRK